MIWWNIRQLKSSNPSRCLRAARGLAKSKNPRAISALLEAFRLSPALFSEAVGLRGGAEAITALLSAISNRPTDADLYRGAKAGVASTKEVVPLDTLLPFTKDKDWRVRELAVFLAGRTQEAGTREVLVSALKDDIDDVRGSAVQSLESLPAESLNARERIELAIVSDKIQDIVAMGQEALEPLGAILENGATEVRRRIPEIVALIPMPSAVLEVLKAVVEDRDWEVRRGAIRGLAKVNDRRVTSILVERLNDKDSAVRSACVDALIKRRDRAAIPAFRSWLASGSYAQRGDALRALQTLGWTPKTSGERALVAVSDCRFSDAISEGPIGIQALIDALAILPYTDRYRATEILRLTNNPSDPTQKIQVPDTPADDISDYLILHRGEVFAYLQGGSLLSWMYKADLGYSSTVPLLPHSGDFRLVVLNKTRPSPYDQYRLSGIEIYRLTDLRPLEKGRLAIMNGMLESTQLAPESQACVRAWIQKKIPEYMLGSPEAKAALDKLG